MRVGYLRARAQNVIERGQTRRKIRVFAEQTLLFSLARGRPGHLPNEMHHRVTVRDIDIELVQRVAAKRLEILLNLHLDIMPCQIGTQLVAISPELVRNRREIDMLA